MLTTPYVQKKVHYLQLDTKQPILTLKKLTYTYFCTVVSIAQSETAYMKNVS